MKSNSSCLPDLARDSELPEKVAQCQPDQPRSIALIPIPHPKNHNQVHLQLYTLFANCIPATSTSGPCVRTDHLPRSLSIICASFVFIFCVLYLYTGNEIGKKPTRTLFYTFNYGFIEPDVWVNFGITVWSECQGKPLLLEDTVDSDGAFVL